jgi:hypothetical protein
LENATATISTTLLQTLYSPNRKYTVIENPANFEQNHTEARQQTKPLFWFRPKTDTVPKNGCNFQANTEIDN